ncbi:MAG: hypothetical protein KA314_24470 [Chloroflexi bacterium]|nr:hypothetical protein [Chloroflexota bacterium]MBP8059001.1 hypothetical protein [Chloroflexota bacterium]
MRQEGVPPGKQSFTLFSGPVSFNRHLAIGMILVVALIAFELFNFDTTQFALESLLGDVRFLGLSWATILAIAFCAIDFAGLARLFTPERGNDEPKEVWYLTGAWLLGTSMNAIMTWWAVSLTLLNHPLGNEVLSREQLLKIVPLFVAVLVWMTRILFIGSLTATGEKLLYGSDSLPAPKRNQVNQPATQPAMSRASQPVRPQPPVLPNRPVATQQTRPSMPVPQVINEEPVYVDVDNYRPQPRPIAAQPEPPTPARPQRPTNNNRVRQRPPGPIRPSVGGLSASPRNHN